MLYEIAHCGYMAELAGCVLFVFVDISCVILYGGKRVTKTGGGSRGVGGASAVPSGQAGERASFPRLVVSLHTTVQSVVSGIACRRHTPSCKTTQCTRMVRLTGKWSRQCLLLPAGTARGGSGTCTFPPPLALLADVLNEDYCRLHVLPHAMNHRSVVW